MRRKDFDKALTLLLEKGLVKVRVIDGRTEYALTKKGLKNAIACKLKQTSDYID